MKKFDIQDPDIAKLIIEQNELAFALVVYAFLTMRNPRD